MQTSTIQDEENFIKLSVEKCRNEWIPCEEYLPVFDKKLILATDKGFVIPARYIAKDLAFEGRLTGNNKTRIQNPKAWRLYPVAPGKSDKPDATMQVIDIQKCYTL